MTDIEIDDFIPALVRRVAQTPPLHRDAVEPTTEPEPPDGTTREQWLKAQLKAAYRGAGATPINSDEWSEAGGLCLHPRFTWHLEALQWVREPYLTRRQALIVERIYRDDLTVREVAQRLSVHHSTIARDRHDALEVLIRIAWNDPTYQLPYRVYTKTQALQGGFDD